MASGIGVSLYPPVNWESLALGEVSMSKERLGVIDRWGPTTEERKEV